MIELFLLLVAAHFVADYPMQGEFLALAKNRLSPNPFCPWYQALGAHAAIHGGFVGVVTGMWWLGVAEFIAHAAIDDAKCMKRISFNQDQALHIVCKVLWCVIAFGVSK